MNRKRNNPHPDHSRYCMVIRSHGWKWNRAARVWHYTNDWTMTCKRACEALAWCLENGVSA